MYEKIAKAYPYSYHVHVDQKKGIITVVIAKIVDVIKHFAENPENFKTEFDFITGPDNIGFFVQYIKRKEEGEPTKESAALLKAEYMSLSSAMLRDDDLDEEKKEER